MPKSRKSKQTTLGSTSSCTSVGVQQESSRTCATGETDVTNTCSSSEAIPPPCGSQSLGSGDGDVMEVVTEEKMAKTPMDVLSDEQRAAMKAVLSSRSVFITGSAGVGKSFLLREIMKCLPEDSTYVTASTGIAACNISGTTFHSFAGVGLGTAPVNQMVYKVKNRKEVHYRWRTCRTLVVDEISMIDGEFFEKIEDLAKRVRNSKKPFGGIQLILCGDFLQLPPVMKNGETKRFCFETPAWTSCVQHTINLKKVFRQKEESFIGLLNRVRVGQMTKEDVRTLETCRNTTFPNDGIKPTILFPNRCSCERVNSNMLQGLGGQSHTYTSFDSGDQHYVDELNRNSNSVKVLTLKVNAQVILLKNLDFCRGLVNGARGFVVGFQGVEEGHSNSEAYFLNRTAALACELVLSFRAERASSQQEDDEQSKEKVEQEASSGPMFPIVRFANGVQQMIVRDSFTVQVGDVVKASRTQIPLALAWALSIHKSQGMTLERVELSLGRVFESGQAYVALSRVTSLEGLLLRDFNPHLIRAHPKVLSYYESLAPSSPTRLQTASAKPAASTQDVMLSRDLRVRPQNAARAHKRQMSPIVVAGSQRKRAFGLGVNVSTASLNCVTWLKCPVSDRLKLTAKSSHNYSQVGSAGHGERREIDEKSSQQIPVSTHAQCIKQVHVQMPSASLSAATLQPSTLSEEQRARIERNRRAALERRQAKMNRPAVR